MKFTVSQTSLADAISVVQRGVATSSTLPILTGVYVRAEDGVLEFQSSDYSTSIRHRIAAHVEDPGETVLPCKMLSNLIKTLPDAPVTFESDGSQVAITCLKTRVHLNALAASDFPSFPAYDVESSVELPVDVLSDMAARVWRVVSTEKTRPLLNGIHMTVENNTIRLVATDAFRLAVCDTHVETSSLEGSFELNVPADAMNDALSIMRDEPQILVGSTDTQVVFEAGSTCYVSRKIEGVYPNYKQLIPATCATRVKLDVEEFNAALKRVSVIAQTETTVRLDIDADAGLLTLTTASSQRDEAQETLEVEVEGASGTIAFNYRYIFGCLNVIGHEPQISLELESYRSPGVFKLHGKIDYLYLIMPVRV